jgi:hypothetical protein
VGGSSLPPPSGSLFSFFIHDPKGDGDHIPRTTATATIAAVSRTDQMRTTKAKGMPAISARQRALHDLLVTSGDRAEKMERGMRKTTAFQTWKTLTR